MKKKYYIIILIIVLLGIIFYVANQIIVKRKINKIPVTIDLIEQYRQQLPELKKTADKSEAVGDLQNYGIAQYATGDFSGAVLTYQKQIAKDPNNYFAHSALANALRDEKKFDEAILEYKKVNELAPNYIAGYINQASVYQYSLKQIDKAIEVYELGIAKNPSSTDLYLLLAMAYEQVDDKDNAEKTYEKVIEIDKTNLAAKTALERLVQ